MKIGLQTWGSEGDVRPFIALAAGLKAAEHDVTLAVTHVENKDYASLCEAFDVRVRHVGRNDPALLKIVREKLVRETNALRQIHLLITHLFEPVVEDMLSAAKRLCKDNELVISHFLAYPLKIVAEQRKLPCASVFMAPMLPSKHLAPSGAANLGKFLNTLLWKLGDVTMNRHFMPPINKMRRREGLPPIRDVMRDVWMSQRLNLVAASPALCSPPPDWGERIRTCGAFQLPKRGTAWRMPDSLRRFLEAGPPPVYMTFGSMTAGDPTAQETTRLLVEAALGAGCRAIIQSDWDNVGGIPEFSSIYRIAAARHEEIFPHCAAVVHHGGAGTSHSASRAGRPSIVVEHLADQTFWGGRAPWGGDRSEDVASANSHRRETRSRDQDRSRIACLEGKGPADRRSHEAGRRREAGGDADRGAFFTRGAEGEVKCEMRGEPLEEDKSSQRRIKRRGGRG